VRIVDSKDQTVTVLHLAPQAAEVLVTEASAAQPDAELAAELQAAALASQEKSRQQAAEMARILNCTDYYQVLLLLTLLILLLILLLQLLQSAAGNAATDFVHSTYELIESAEVCLISASLCHDSMTIQ
jgi:hypothetical protein